MYTYIHIYIHVKRIVNATSTIDVATPLITSTQLELTKMYVSMLIAHLVIQYLISILI